MLNKKAKKTETNKNPEDYPEFKEYDKMVLLDKVSFRLLTIVILICVILDVLINKNIFHGIIHLSESYVIAIFTAVFTVATLGGTLLTIIISAFSEEIYGYRFRMVFEFDSYKLNTTKILPFMLGSVLLALALMIFNAVNALSAVLLFIVAYLSISSYMIWKMINNQNFVFVLLCREVGRGEEDIHHLAVLSEHFFNMYTSHRHDFDQETALKYLIDKINQSKYDDKKIKEKISAIQQHFFNIYFNKLIETKGFYNAINIFETYIESLIEYHKQNGRNKLRLFDGIFSHLKMIDIKLLLTTINKEELLYILNLQFLDESQKVELLVSYFESIHGNYNIQENTKLSHSFYQAFFEAYKQILFNKQFLKSSEKVDFSGFEKISYDSLYLILVDVLIIIIFSDDDRREDAFKCMLREIYSKNSDDENICLKSCSLIYFYIVLFSYFEISLNEDYRKKIAALLQTKIHNKQDGSYDILTLDTLTFNESLYLEIEFLLEVVLDNTSIIVSFEKQYFPVGIRTKPDVDTFENRIKIIYCLSVIYNYQQYDKSFFDIDIIKLLPNKNLKRYYEVLDVISSLFDLNNQCYTKEVSNVISHMHPNLLKKDIVFNTLDYKYIKSIE